jgi:chromosome segregation ATPase
VSARILFVATLGLTLGGCNAYLDAKSDMMSGGPQNRVAAAQANYTAAKQDNQNLQDQLLATNRDIERNEKRIASAKDDLAKTNSTLTAALNQKKLSAQSYDKLKRESDAINRELSTLNLQLQADRDDPSKAADVAAKEQKLRDLEKRKADLDKAIRLSLGGTS